MLFKKHYSTLVSYARKMVHTQDVAEDIVQQLFVSLWEKRSSLDIQGSLDSYMLRSTHNACLNHFKHLKTRQEHGQHVKSTETESYSADLLEEAEFKLKVKSAVQKLPTQCKRVFLMSRLQQKKYKEIAEELDISIKTVENQMGKALRILREELKTEHKPHLHVIRTILWLCVGVSHFSIVMK
mgnify:CR=1 FL=1